LLTVTEVFPETVPLVAVTVIVDPGVALPDTRVAVAVPVASVVPCVTVMLPALAAKVTTAPLTAALLASFATTVIVAEVEPSDGMLAALEETARVATVLGGGALLDPEMVLPPQALSKHRPTIPAIRSARAIRNLIISSSSLDSRRIRN
jgi:phenylpyruvate tautomerase PptA (4-oxalocrotonate tautomerase family)